MGATQSARTHTSRDAIRTDLPHLWTSGVVPRVGLCQVVDAGGCRCARSRPYLHEGAQLPAGGPVDFSTWFLGSPLHGAPGTPRQSFWLSAKLLRNDCKSDCR